MVDIYVDADACPVKDETLRVAARHGLKTYLVSDGGIRPSQNPLVELVIVDQGPDAADDWIATHIQKSDICVTNDIPLAARCLERGAWAIKPNGDALATQRVREGRAASPQASSGVSLWRAACDLAQRRDGASTRPGSVRQRYCG